MIYRSMNRHYQDARSEWTPAEWTPAGLRQTPRSGMVLRDRSDHSRSRAESIGVRRRTVFGVQKVNFKRRLRLESDWSPTGVRLESDWSPTGVRMKSDSSPSGVQVESEWSLSGVRVESSGVRSDTASWFHLYFTRDP